jgi:hypothetical protein
MFIEGMPCDEYLKKKSMWGFRQRTKQWEHDLRFSNSNAFFESIYYKSLQIARFKLLCCDIIKNNNIL